MITVIRLSAALLAGRRWWLLPLSPALWLLAQAGLLIAGGRPSFEPAAAQNILIGLPVAVLGVFLGGRIVAGELDERTLEVAYTVPGGTRRVWIGKLAAACLMLLLALGLMAILTFAFFTPFPIVQTLYGAFQGVIFYLAASMGMSTLFRSQATGALAAGGILALNGWITAPGAAQLRVSPLWNPLAIEGADAEQLLAMGLQNRIGTALAIAAIVALTFARAERREKMLSG